MKSKFTIATCGLSQRSCCKFGWGSLWRRVFLTICVPSCLPRFTFHSDLRRVGVNLAGHQKKILNSIQEMRVQMINMAVPIWCPSNVKSKKKKDLITQDCGSSLALVTTNYEHIFMNREPWKKRKKQKKKKEKNETKNERGQWLVMWWIRGTKMALDKTDGPAAGSWLLVYRTVSFCVLSYYFLFYFIFFVLGKRVKSDG